MTSQNTNSPRAVFLDRDGTLIEDKHYLCQPEGVCLLPGVAEALASLQEAGVQLFVVTNQSGIARGYYTEEQYKACEQQLDNLLQEQEVRVETTRHCPHDPDAGCGCRKPGIGMWEDLRSQYHLEAARCAMVGDKAVDLSFGINAGFPLAILVLTGKGGAEASRLGASLPLQSEYAPLKIQEGPLAQDGTSLFLARNMAAAQACINAFWNQQTH